MVGPPPTPVINPGAVFEFGQRRGNHRARSFVSIYGQNFTSLAYGWDWAIPDGKTLPRWWRVRVCASIIRTLT